MPAPVLVISAWVALKYGSVKSMTASRSALIVIAPAPTSHWPLLSASPVVIVSHATSRTSVSRPLASAAISSTAGSKPTTSPPSVNSNGS